MGKVKLRERPTGGFLISGSGPRLLALDPAAYARWHELPRRVGQADAQSVLALADDAPLTIEELGPRGLDGLVDLTTATELIVQVCTRDAGREYLRADWGSGDLSRALEASRPGGLDQASWEILRSLVKPSKEGKPWWLAERFHRCCNYGLAAPEQVRALCAGARSAEAASFALPGVLEFLAELGSVAPRWLACTEW